MSRINRADWTKERIAAFKRFLAGDKEVAYRGKKKNGEPYKKALKVAKLIEYYQGYDFSIGKGNKLMVSGEGHGPREILTDDQVVARVQALYKHKETGLGKAPSIYQFMTKKYVNVSYRKVERAVQALPGYQKYQARHVQKPKVRKVIVSEAPGAQLDVDLMFMAEKYYDAGENEGYTGLAILVDRFSGYIAISPVRKGGGNKTADKISAKVVSMMRSPAFPTKQNGKIFHDNGSEFQGIFPERMRQQGYESIVISASAGAPSAHVERAVGIVKKLVNQKLTANDTIPRPKSRRAKWWPMVRSIVNSYNDTPLTDARAPHSPNELKRMNGAARNRIMRAMIAAGSKRVRKAPGRTDPNTGAKVSKSLKILKVGDRVRYAVENIRKTGANQRKYPKQRWSDSVHTVTRVVVRKLGFASYVLSGLARRRFEREDLQGPLA